MKRVLIAIIGLSYLLSCTRDTEHRAVTQEADYNAYLSLEERSGYEAAVDEMEFWSKRLRPDSSGVGDLGPLAAAYTKMFEYTGDSQHLYDAEFLLKKAGELSTNNKDIYHRALARNYITQHRFQEARVLLEESYAGASSKRATEFMLFDVYMELGAYEEAENLLSRTKNLSDYNYLIRQAKWSDYKGDLDSAIQFLEKARDIAESRNSKALMIWTHSNLADFYGHAERIPEAYQGYLRTLELDPENTYALKGIAWIAYSWEDNADEALRILDTLAKNHHVPDYDLLKSEIFEYLANEELADKYQDKFIQKVKEGNYGNMYNTYRIELLAESSPSEANELALKEVEYRPTPETYWLLAYTELVNGRKEEAQRIIEQQVIDKSFEPMAAYYAAKIYRAVGNDSKVQDLKKELLGASFEIGPLLSAEVSSW